MKSIRDTSDDAAVLDAISVNRRIPSHAIIHNNLNFLKAAYLDYSDKRGDPWEVTGYVKAVTLADAMGALYTSKSATLAHIGQFRKRHSGKCCAMCGSLNNAQIDHYLPQLNYPEFSIFMPNLFPACHCNQAKGIITTGPAADERFLHPAYDRGISERSIFVRIRDHDVAPRFSLVFRRPRKSVPQAAFDFHTRTLVNEDALKGYIREKFSELCERPGQITTQLRRNPGSKDALRTVLLEELEECCVSHQTKNNWESVFFHSLLERRTLQWLWKKFSVPGRIGNSPLI